MFNSCAFISLVQDVQIADLKQGTLALLCADFGWGMLLKKERKKPSVFGNKNSITEVLASDLMFSELKDPI